MLNVQIEMESDHADVFQNTLETLMLDVNQNVLQTLTVLPIRLVAGISAKTLALEFAD